MRGAQETNTGTGILTIMLPHSSTHVAPPSESRPSCTVWHPKTVPTGGGDNGTLRGSIHDPGDCRRRCFKGSPRQPVGDKQAVAGTSTVQLPPAIMNLDIVNPWL